eukprot:Gb_27034 [translate_table: standard]
MGIRPGRPFLSAGASWALPRSPIRCLDVTYTPRGTPRASPSVVSTNRVRAMKLTLIHTHWFIPLRPGPFAPVTSKVAIPLSRPRNQLGIPAAGLDIRIRSRFNYFLLGGPHKGELRVASQKTLLKTNGSHDSAALRLILCAQRTLCVPHLRTSQRENVFIPLSSSLIRGADEAGFAPATIILGKPKELSEEGEVAASLLAPGEEKEGKKMSFISSTLPGREENENRPPMVAVVGSRISRGGANSSLVLQQVLLWRRSSTPSIHRTKAIQEGRFGSHSILSTMPIGEVLRFESILRCNRFDPPPR